MPFDLLIYRKKQIEMTDKKREPLPLEAIIPVLSSDNITQADILTASKVLNAISKFHPKHKLQINGEGKQYKKRTREEALELYQDSSLRPIRKAIAGVFELHKLQLYDGFSEEDYYANRIEERTLKRQKMAEKLQQKKYIADTQLRRGRIEKLEKLKMDSKEEEEARLKIQAMMIPDGHVDTEMNAKMIGDGQSEEKESKEDESIKLPKLRSCYVCKVSSNFSMGAQESVIQGRQNLISSS